MQLFENERKVGPLLFRVDEGSYSYDPSLAEKGENLFFCIDWYSDDFVPMRDKSRLALELGRMIDGALAKHGVESRRARFDMGTEEDIFCVKAKSSAKAQRMKELVNEQVDLFEREKFQFAVAISGAVSELRGKLN